MSETVIECLRKKAPSSVDTTERILVGIALLLFTAISFVLNISLGYLVCRTNTFDKVFRWHVVSLLAAALSYLITNSTILIPTALFGLEIDDPLNTILTIFDVFGYLALTFTTTMIAADRFIVFYVRKLYFHSSPSSSLVAFSLPALPWSLSIILTIHMNVIGCYARTDPFTLTYTYECSECGLYSPIMYYLNISLPAIAFALYSAIYVKIVLVPKHVETADFRNEKKKIALVIQCSLICAAQFASSASFYVVPAMMSGNGNRYYLTMLISTLNSMTNPCVMFAFQKRLRHAICGRRGTDRRVFEKTLKIYGLAISSVRFNSRS